MGSNHYIILYYFKTIISIPRQIFNISCIIDLLIFQLTDSPIDRLKIQNTRFIDSPNKLVVSELKLKNLFVQTLDFNVGVGFIRPDTLFHEHMVLRVR